MATTKQVNLRLSIDLIEAYQRLADDAEERDRAFFMKKALKAYFSEKPKAVEKFKAAVAEKPVGKDWVQVDKVIGYLNLKAGTNYRFAASSRDLVEARLKDFTVEDCFVVIDKKCAEWLGTDLAKYLRPSTLFQASKFEGYLNQLEGGANGKGGVQSLADRSAEQTQKIHAMLAAGHFDQRVMGQDGAALSPSLGESGGREDCGGAIDAEFSLVVQEDGVFDE